MCRINLKKIQALGKEFLWNKPSRCPGCGGMRLWGHGHVLRYFFPFSYGLWMKRWRCPDCAGVHTARPWEYIPGNHYPHTLRIRSISRKLTGKPFITRISRQLQQYWMKAFWFQCRKTGNREDPLEFLDRAVVHGQRVVTKRVLYRVIPCGLEAPYLPFAVTTR